VAPNLRVAALAASRAKICHPDPALANLARGTGRRPRESPVPVPGALPHRSDGPKVGRGGDMKGQA